MQGDLGSCGTQVVCKQCVSRRCLPAQRARFRRWHTVPFPFFWVPGVSLTLYLGGEKAPVRGTWAAATACRPPCQHSLVVGHGGVGSADGDGKEQDVLRVRLPRQGVQQRLALLGGQRSFAGKPTSTSCFTGRVSPSSWIPPVCVSQLQTGSPKRAPFGTDSQLSIFDCYNQSPRSKQGGFSFKFKETGLFPALGNTPASTYRKSVYQETCELMSDLIMAPTSLEPPPLRGQRPPEAKARDKHASASFLQGKYVINGGKKKEDTGFFKRRELGSRARRSLGTAEPSPCGGLTPAH